MHYETRFLAVWFANVVSYRSCINWSWIDGENCLEVAVSFASSQCALTCLLPFFCTKQTCVTVSMAVLASLECSQIELELPDGNVFWGWKFSSMSLFGRVLSKISSHEVEASPDLVFHFRDAISLTTRRVLAYKCPTRPQHPTLQALHKKQTAAWYQLTREDG